MRHGSLQRCSHHMDGWVACRGFVVPPVPGRAGARVRTEGLMGRRVLEIRTQTRRNCWCWAFAAGRTERSECVYARRDHCLCMETDTNPTCKAERFSRESMEDGSNVHSIQAGLTDERSSSSGTRGDKSKRNFCRHAKVALLAIHGGWIERRLSELVVFKVGENPPNETQILESKRKVSGLTLVCQG